MLQIEPLTIPIYFNSRPSARGDEKRPRLSACSMRFQFTPLREGRLVLIRKSRWNGRFQFTPLREGRRCKFTLLPFSAYFNSRPSARGDRFLRSAF